MDVPRVLPNSEIICVKFYDPYVKCETKFIDKTVCTS